MLEGENAKEREGFVYKPAATRGKPSDMFKLTCHEPVSKLLHKFCKCVYVCKFVYMHVYVDYRG